MGGKQLERLAKFPFRMCAVEVLGQPTEYPGLLRVVKPSVVKLVTVRGTSFRKMASSLLGLGR